MPTLWEIDDQIEAILEATVDRETGEISEEGIKALDELGNDAARIPEFVDDHGAVVTESESDQLVGDRVDGVHDDVFDRGRRRWRWWRR